MQSHSAGLHLFLQLRHLPLLHGLFVVSGGLALDDFDRTGGAFGQAVAHAVAVVVLDELRLTVHHRNRALVAGVCAQSAARAFRLVYLDNLSFHGMVDDMTLTHNDSTKKLVRKIRRYVDFLKSNPDFQTEFFEFGDGVAVTKKK
jgi:hypothetical protein